MSNAKSLAESMIFYATHSSRDADPQTPERLAACQEAIELGGLLGTLSNDEMILRLRDAAARHQHNAPAICAFMDLIADDLDEPRRLTRMASTPQPQNPSTSGWQKPRWAVGRKFDVDQCH